MKWLHQLLKGVSLTGALFVFQACYGTPAPLYDERGEAPMSFKVVSQLNGEPLAGIKIYSEPYQNSQYPPVSQELGVTGTDGTCRVEIPYIRNMQGPFVHFKDPNGQLVQKDTILLDLREREILIKLTPGL